MEWNQLVAGGRGKDKEEGAAERIKEEMGKRLKCAHMYY